MAEIAKSRAAQSGTARGCGSAYQTLMVVLVVAAGMGTDARRVSTISSNFEYISCEYTSTMYCVCFSILCIYVYMLFFFLSACHNDMYGPDCRLSCRCQNGGMCNRFSGCQCPTGWRGQNCEKSGTFLCRPHGGVHIWQVLNS